MQAQRRPLADGRWHFGHGPIDLVIAADGEPGAVRTAHAAAWARFQGLLAELVAELPVLRQPVDPAHGQPLRGPVARRMWAACAPLVDAAQGFLTPMAAVAGAVADAVIEAYRQPGVTRAAVNNGGDIALHLTPGTQWRIGLWADLADFDATEAARSAAGTLAVDGAFTLAAAQPARGVATSGWRGRSFSRGIADSVTVLAATAAEADAAATVIANAVNLDDARIERRPAAELKDDSDLGDLLVTVAVPPLPPEAVRAALAAGRAMAQRLWREGRLTDAALTCQGQLIRLHDDGVMMLPARPQEGAASRTNHGQIPLPQLV